MGERDFRRDEAGGDGLGEDFGDAGVLARGEAGGDSGARTRGGHRELRNPEGLGDGEDLGGGGGQDVLDFRRVAQAAAWQVGHDDVMGSGKGQRGFVQGQAGAGGVVQEDAGGVGCIAIEPDKTLAVRAVDIAFPGGLAHCHLPVGRCWRGAGEFAHIGQGRCQAFVLGGGERRDALAAFERRQPVQMRVQHVLHGRHIDCRQGQRLGGAEGRLAVEAGGAVGREIGLA